MVISDDNLLKNTVSTLRTPLLL